MDTKFSRLVRFKAADGHIYYGEAGLDLEKALRGQEVETFTGSGPWDGNFQLSGKRAVVDEVRWR